MIEYLQLVWDVSTKFDVFLYCVAILGYIGLFWLNKLQRKIEKAEENAKKNHRKAMNGLNNSGES